MRINGLFWFFFIVWVLCLGVVIVDDVDFVVFKAIRRVGGCSVFVF